MTVGLRMITKAEGPGAGLDVPVRSTGMCRSGSGRLLAVPSQHEPGEGEPPPGSSSFKFLAAGQVGSGLLALGRSKPESRAICEPQLELEGTVTASAAAASVTVVKLGQLPEPMQEVRRLPVQVWEALRVVSKASGSVVQLHFPEPAWGAMRVPVRFAVLGSARQQRIQLGVVMSARS